MSLVTSRIITRFFTETEIQFYFVVVHDDRKSSCGYFRKRSPIEASMTYLVGWKKLGIVELRGLKRAAC